MIGRNYERREDGRAAVEEICVGTRNYSTQIFHYRRQTGELGVRIRDISGLEYKDDQHLATHCGLKYQ
jgi:hypothetical protein